MRLFIPIALLFFCACAGYKNTLPTPNRTAQALDHKMEPYDHFSQQRSFPDREIDVAGYHKALAYNAAREKTLLRGNPCNSTVPKWKEHGPANIAGRVNSVVAQPGNENVVLAGFAGGGIFKSTDGAVTWRAVFEEHPNLSIGCLTFDPSDPNVVYAGTGDSNLPAYLYNGTGIFKSTDTGETWQKIGLEQQGIISKIVVSPTDPNVIFAACMGNPFKRDNERGIYKSTDGGQTWTQKLFVSNQAGASGLVVNKQNPNIVYASFWDRIRTNQESFVSGPNAKFYKSTDGGENWTQLTNGLPAGKNGRTSLTISQTNPFKLYALIVDTLSKTPQIFKTVDGGDSWFQLIDFSLIGAYSDFGWYFGQLRINPTNDEELYLLAISMSRKLATSSQFSSYGQVHADVHDLIFTESGRQYVATDGGIYTKNNGENIFVKSLNLPTTQFYHLNVNPNQPDTYYGGAQDNGTSKGNAANYNNWQSILGADGFKTQFLPNNSGAIWGETQNGNIYRSYDGGSNWTSTGTCIGTTDRCNWDMPYFVSKHGPVQDLYAGTFRVYRSRWNDSNWVPVSSDLTKGNIYGARFHTISALNESPVTPGKIMVGTSDGNVWRTDELYNYINISSGLPERYVTSVHCSPTLSDRLFVTHSGWRDNQQIPHIHRSDNNGAIWTDISGDLPNLPVNDLLVVPNHQDSVLVCASDGGVYFSKNSGITWDKLGSNMPYVPVFDVEWNDARKEIAVGTYGRGAWTIALDSVLSQSLVQPVPISGTITNDAGQGVKNTQIVLTSSNADGSFRESLPGCQPYTLKPARNDNPLNGVTTYDLFLMSKHILGITPLETPYRIIGGDINRSGSLTSFDIVSLRRLILGIDTVFSSNTSWRFVPKNWVFQDPSNPFSSVFPEEIPVTLQNEPVNNLDFIGIKIGDMDGNAIPSDAVPVAEARSEPILDIFTDDRIFQKSEELAQVFSVHTGQLAAIQFTLEFDPKKIKFWEITPLFPGLTDEHFGLNKVKEGKITVCFEVPDPIKSSVPDIAQLFSVRFTSLQSGNIQDVFHITSAATYAVAYDGKGGAFQPVLDFSKGPIACSDKFEIIPSVFGENGTFAHIFMDDDAFVSFHIIDNQGRTVYSFNDKLKKGQNSIQLGASIFKQPGLYHCEGILQGKPFISKIIYLQ